MVFDFMTNQYLRGVKFLEIRIWTVVVQSIQDKVSLSPQVWIIYILFIDMLFFAFVAQFFSCLITPIIELKIEGYVVTFGQETLKSVKPKRHWNTK